MSPLIVAGLDLSLTSTGGAKVQGGILAEPPWTFTIRSIRRGYERLDSMVNRIGAAIKEIDPAVIVVEGPALHATGSYVHESAGLWWSVTHRIWKSGRPMAVVPPTVLKKFATGKGNSDKSAMCVAAAHRFGLAEIGPDAADALWLAAAGAQRYGQPVVSMPAAQVAVLTGIGKKGKPVIDWPELPAPALTEG